MPRHPLENRLGWLKLGLLVLVGLLGFATQFDVNVKQEVVKVKTVKLKDSRDGKLAKGVCESLRQQKGKERNRFISTFGLPKDFDGDFSDDLIYQIRGTDGDQECWLMFDHNGKLFRVQQTLWGADDY